jgi:hypothetical protein
MARKRTSTRSTPPSPEDELTQVIPRKESPRKLLFPVLWLCGSLVMSGSECMLL